MIRKIKMALGGALVGLVGFFWLLFQRRSAQRDDAIKQRNQARSAKEAMQAAKEVEKTVMRKQHEQLKHNEEARQKRREQEPADRFVGRLDVSRLRGKSGD